MTVSTLSQYTQISPNTSGLRTAPISKITVHHMAGDLDIWTCANVFAPVSRQASSNYGVDSAGRIACYLPEEYHPWTSASYWNDDRAITIEVADYDCYNWVPSEAAYKATVELCADICDRYGIEPEYDGSIYASFTEHQMFASTNCPGPWWHSHMYDFVEDVKACMRGEFDMEVHEVWEYAWYNPEGENTAPGGNMYNCAVATYHAVDRIEASVNKLVDAISGAAITIDADIDYAKLAKAVNDDAARRMKE